jgi:hypothetical protein
MSFLCMVAWSVLAVIFLPYLLHHALLGFFKGRNLKERYNAEWALVTGASSGAPPSSSKLAMACSCVHTLRRCALPQALHRTQ